MTYLCDFLPSKQGGHYHLTEEEAETCKNTWKAWNVWDRTKGDLNPYRESPLNKRNF
jgi:hypothetical protein